MSSNRRISRAVALTLGMLIVATCAFAVTVTVTPRDQDDNSLPGTTILLIPKNGGPTVSAADEDGDGTVQLEAADGEYTLVVRHPDSQTTRIPVTVRPGQSKPIIVNVPRLPPLQQPPCHGCLNVGSSMRFDMAPDWSVTGGKQVTAVDFNGSQFTETETTDPASVDKVIGSEIDATEVELGIGWGRGRTPGGRSERRFWGLSRQLVGSNDDRADDGRSPRWSFSPAFSVSFGNADVQFEFQDTEDPAERTSFEGDGTILGLRFEGIWSRCADCPWFAGVRLGYRTTGTIDVVRTPALQFEGATYDDDVEFEHEARTVGALIGYLFRNTATYGGLRATYKESTLKGVTRSDFSQFFGVPVTQVSTYFTDFEDDTVEALLGLNARFPKSRWFLKVEGSTDGDNESVLLSLAYGFRGRSGGDRSETPADR